MRFSTGYLTAIYTYISVKTVEARASLDCW